MGIQVRQLDGGRLLVNEDYIDVLSANGIETAGTLWAVEGETVKKCVESRGTERSYLKNGTATLEVYVKRYQPVPLKERLKCMFGLKPVFPDCALHEWEAILAFHRERIETMVPIAAASLADGRTVDMTLGIASSRRASEILSESCPRQTRTRLVERIATLAGRLHSARFAHQDFYLVHLFVKDDLSVLPIDLQRVIMGRQFSMRWQAKDLAQLLFSSQPHVSRTDIMRFWKIYTRYFPNLCEDRGFIGRVVRKAGRMTRSASKRNASRV
ncbi:MAG: hypothetical protein JW808_10035 [Victivallales bacterium]|nr:hypothetical protein [Victivallales bacterium]